ncbi:DUF6453 family protein [Candidatus Symbiopectobacterium sp. NZEC127]|uniref:DUF6453 family protein n=1 Tax=Candidatus Symbiopectobacterium sp. NZEC127 TaxID=2820472 RepID=UPI002227011C|nr:DUF6453 family protein [Candidatus Symbiopectobacterium sp. NZEC127]
MMLKFEVFSKTINKNISFLENNRTLNYIGELENTQEWNPLPKSLSVDSRVMFIPFKPYVLGRTWSDFYGLHHVELSPDRTSVRFHTTDISASLPIYGGVDWKRFYGPCPCPNAKQAKIHVYEHDNSHSTSDYGLYLSNSTDYFSLIDSDKNGCVVWAYSGAIESGYSLPDTLPNREGCLVFAHWDDLNYAIRLDEDRRIRIYNRTWSMTTVAQENRDVSLPIKLLAVTSSANLPVSDPGLTLWNAKGNVMLSSDYPPVKVVEFFTLDFDRQGSDTIKLGSGDAAYLIPVCSSIGTMLMPLNVYRASNQGISFSMGNNCVRVSQSAYFGDSGPGGNYQYTRALWQIPEWQLPLLLVDDYF